MSKKQQFYSILTALLTPAAILSFMDQNIAAGIGFTIVTVMSLSLYIHYSIKNNMK